MNVHIRNSPANGYRIRREQLDRCLDLLEEAVERGEQRVSVGLAATLQRFLPSVRNGVALEDARRQVFAQQQRLFALRESSDPPMLAEGSDSDEDLRLEVTCLDGGVPTMSRIEAEDITGKIRDGLGELPLMLLEAHLRRAWVALGYSSWEQYVRVEFRLSRSRSYELLDQARVIKALRSAVGDRNLPPISGLAAREIKSILVEVVDDVRQHLPDESAQAHPDNLQAIVREAVARARIRVHSDAGTRDDEDRMAELVPQLPDRAGVIEMERTSGAVSGLIDAVALLANQRSAVEVLRTLSDAELLRLGRLSAATRCLMELFEALPAEMYRRSLGGAERDGQHLLTNVAHRFTAVATSA